MVRIISFQENDFACAVQLDAKAGEERVRNGKQLSKQLGINPDKSLTLTASGFDWQEEAESFVFWFISRKHPERLDKKDVKTRKIVDTLAGNRMKLYDALIKA